MIPNYKSKNYSFIGAIRDGLDEIRFKISKQRVFKYLYTVSKKFPLILWFNLLKVSI